jgi:hypothetical protein
MIIKLIVSQKTMINFYTLVAIIIFSIPFITIHNAFSYSQVFVLPQTFNIQNNSNVILPSSNGETKRIYGSNFENHSVTKISSKSTPVNNSLSFNIINAAITIIDKLINGITKVDLPETNQTIVIPEEKKIIGKRS